VARKRTGTDSEVGVCNLRGPEPVCTDWNGEPRACEGARPPSAGRAERAARQLRLLPCSRDCRATLFDQIHELPPNARRRHRAATTRASGVYVRGLLSADVVDLLSPNAERLVPLVTRLAVDAQLPLVPRTRSERQRRKDARKRSQQASSRRMTRRSPDLKLRLDMHRPIGHLDRVTVRSHEGRARSSASCSIRPTALQEVRRAPMDRVPDR